MYANIYERCAKKRGFPPLNHQVVIYRIKKKRMKKEQWNGMGGFVEEREK